MEKINLIILNFNTVVEDTEMKQLENQMASMSQSNSPSCLMQLHYFLNNCRFYPYVDFFG